MKLSITTLINNGTYWGSIAEALLSEQQLSDIAKLQTKHKDFPFHSTGHRVSPKPRIDQIDNDDQR